MKHGFGFDDVLPLFFRESLFVGARKGSDGERRTMLVGEIEDNVYLVVVLTQGEKTRIVSARRATSKERRLYLDSRKRWRSMFEDGLD